MKHEKSFKYLSVAILIFLAAGALTGIFKNLEIIARDDVIDVVWDMAIHGYYGVLISDAVSRCDFPDLLTRTISQNDYPFVHSYILGCVFSLMGKTLKAAILPSIFAYFLCSITIYLFIWNLSLGRKNFWSIVAVFFLFTSPLYTNFSLLVMLEIFGSLFTLIGLLFYCKAVKHNNSRLYLFSFLGLTVLFLTKYNYGLFLLVTILIAEFLFMEKSIRNFLKQEIRNFIRIKNLFSPLNILIAFVLLLIITIVITGGFDLAFFTSTISCSHVQNPFYLFILLLCIKATLYYCNNKEIIRTHIPHKWVLFFYAALIPVLLWFLTPQKIDAFFNFAVNRSSNIALFSMKNLLFYPKALLSDYFISWPLFIFCILLYLFSLFTIKKESRSIKILHIYVLVTLLFMTLHPFKISRSIFVAVPFIWIISCSKADFLSSRYLSTKYFIPLTALICSIGLFFHFTLIKDFYTKTLVKKSEYWFNSKHSLKPVIKDILHICDSDHNTTIIGTFNELSPFLIEWNLYKDNKIKSKRTIKYDPDFDDLLTANKDSVHVVIGLKVLEESYFSTRDYRNYNRHKMDIISNIEKNKMFISTRNILYEDLQISLSVYENAPLVLF